MSVILPLTLTWNTARIFDGFFTIVLKRVHSPEKAISFSLNVSPKRLERMIYLLKELHAGDQLNISSAAIRFNIAENAVRKDLLLLVEKGWVIASGTTSNRQFRLSQQAIEQFRV